MSPDLVERIRLGWVVLAEAETPVAGGFRTQPVVEAGDGSLLLGLDGAGVPCLLIPTDERGPEESVGVVRIRNSELDTSAGVRSFVVVSCSEPSLRDVFDHFLVGVVTAVQATDGRSPGATAADVLARWRSLFQAGGEALGHSALAALLAELLILEAIVKRDESRSLAVWTGPSQARHDLRRSLAAVEVKATLSHTAREVTIHGVDQLEPPQGGRLTLAWHRLEVVPDGPLSVFVLADRLIAAGASAVELYGRMEQAGSPASLREEHDGVRFALHEQRFFAVDDDFPRVVPATFPAGVPRGVDDITYKVALPAPDLALGGAAVEAVLAEMAGVT